MPCFLMLPDPADYRRLQPHDGVWCDAITTIALRHGLGATWSRPASGSNIVFMGEAAVIKLFCPTWAPDATVEHDVLLACADRLPVDSPRVLARGELEGWPYLVISRLRGRELGPRWPTLDDAHRQRLVVQAAELLAALHAVPPPDGLPEAWPHLHLPVDRVVDKHRRQDALPGWIDEIETALRDEPELTGPDVLLHGDVRPEHLMLDDGGDLCGLFDFADCMRGPAEYDVAATACLMALHVPLGADNFCRTYGFVDRRRLVPALLRQRYCALKFVFSGIPSGLRPDTVAGLLALMEGLPDTATSTKPR